MAVPRPPGPTLAHRLLVRVHPRRLRRRLPLAVVAAAAVAVVPGLGFRAAPAGPPQRTVLVALADLTPGQVLAPADVGTRRVPTDVVAADALSRLPDDAVVRAAISRGEVVTARRVGAGGTGIPAQLDADRRAVTIPWGAARPPLLTGDEVDLIATTAGATSGPASSSVIVSGALVLAVADDGLTVSVPASSSTVVHQAVATGVVDVAITPFAR